MKVRSLFTVLAFAALALPAIPSSASAQVVLANVRVRAEIDRIDRESRTLFLRGPNGGVFERRVPDEMGNFGGLQPGEMVTVTFLNEIGLHLREPGAPLPDLSEMDVPANRSTILNVIQARVTQVDASENAVSLMSLAGRSIEATFRVPPELSLSEFAVGDEIDVAYVFPDVVGVERN